MGITNLLSNRYEAQIILLKDLLMSKIDYRLNAIGGVVRRCAINDDKNIWSRIGCPGRPTWMELIFFNGLEIVL